MVPSPHSLEVDVTEHIAVVTLTGPGRGNALGADFFSEFPRAIAELDKDPAVRAIVVTGANGNFSFGLDLTGMKELLEPLRGTADARARFTYLERLRQLQDAVGSIAAAHTPVVASISGWCIGGGIDLVSGADVRVASVDAAFSIREAKLAVVADLGSLQRLVGIVGDGHLRELALTGEDFDAVRAQSIGLVNHVVQSPEESLEQARTIARRIATNSPLVTRGIKEVLSADRAERIATGLRHVAVWNSAFMATHDLDEALTAFEERREPRFRGH